MPKIPVYFVPGLASSHLIFEKIKLPESEFECIFLKWDIPQINESLLDYSKRYCQHIKHENPVLIGCSFGGLVVQEMMQFIKTRRVIIISSAKCNQEYPRRFKVAKFTKLHKLVPVSFLVNIDRYTKFHFNRWIDERLKLYHRYLGVKDKSYWYWAIDKVINWDRKVPDKNVIHIHGDKDEIFPPRYIKDFIPIKGGTHIMVINKTKTINEMLPALIMNGKL